MKRFSTATMYNTASVTVVHRFPILNLGILFPGTFKFAAGVPLKWFPSHQQPSVHGTHRESSPSLTHSFVLSEGERKEKRGGIKKASPGLQVKNCDLLQSTMLSIITNPIIPDRLTQL